jgi:hypothetical protein
LASSLARAVSCPVAVAARQARRWAMQAVVWEAQRWAMAAVPDAVTRPVRPAAAALAPGAFGLDAAAARFRTEAVPAADAPAVPLREAVAWEALDATAVPRRAAVAVGAVSDVAAVLPRAAAVRHVGAAAEAEAAPHAAAAGRPPAARAAAAALPDAAAVPAVALPSAVAWAFRQDPLRPAAP